MDEHLQEVWLLGHKVYISHVSSQVADDIWNKEDKLIVWLDCHEEPFDSIVGTAVKLPVKDYTREELVEAVVKYGEPQVKATLDKHIKENREHNSKMARQSALNSIASTVEAKLRRGREGE